MTDRDHFAAAALTGLLYPEVDDEFAMPYIVGRAYLWADAMLRERCREGGDCPGQDNAANLDAVPAVKAGTPGTVDTPKPINDCVSDRSKPITGPDPDSRVWETHTPAAHATHGEGSVPRECTEPEAWAVCCPNDGDWSPCFFHEPHAQRCANAIVGEKNVVPLYRHPPVTKPMPKEKQAEVSAEPVAWAVMLADGERIYDVYATEEEAKAIDEAVTGNHGVVPLYRQPTLTDAEREALERICEAADDIIDEDKRANGVYWQDDAAAVAVVRGLLERLG